jgi:hypothetical protein
MKLIKITDEHYIVVDDSEIKEGEWVFNYFENSIKQFGKFFADDWFKITHSTQPLGSFEEFYKKHPYKPTRSFTEEDWYSSMLEEYQESQLSLSEVKELIGEVDVEKTVEYDWMLHTEGSIVVTDKNDWKSGFHHGYDQALEDNKEKKYTEEDLRKALSQAFMASHEDYQITSDEIIKSLQYKTEWEVKFDEQGKLKLV